MPFNLHDSYSVRYGDSFILVGGWNSDGGWAQQDTLLMYRPEDDEKWLELKGKLRKPRARHTAILVDKAIFPHCGSDSSSASALSISGHILAPLLIAVFRLKHALFLA